MLANWSMEMYRERNRFEDKAMGIYNCRFASTARMLQKLPHIFFIIWKKFHYYQTYKGIAFKHEIRKFGIRKTAIKTI